MKKSLYSTAAIFTLIIATAGVAGAQTATNTGTTTGRWTKYYEQRQKNLADRKAKIDNKKVKVASTTAKIEERLEDRQARIASTSARLTAEFDRRASSTAQRTMKLEEKYKTGVSNKIAHVVDVLSSTIDRMKDIDLRITSRIAKLKATNVDASKTETLLVDAQTKLTTATQKVTALESSVGSILGGTISTATKTAVKAKIADARDSVKSAHAAYVKVVESIQPETNTTNSTSTATSTI